MEPGKEGARVRARGGGGDVVVVGERIATIIRFRTPSERRKRGDVLSTKAFPYVYDLGSRGGVYM